MSDSRNVDKTRQAARLVEWATLLPLTAACGFGLTATAQVLLLHGWHPTARGLIALVGCTSCAVVCGALKRPAAKPMIIGQGVLGLVLLLIARLGLADGFAADLYALLFIPGLWLLPGHTGWDRRRWVAFTMGSVAPLVGVAAGNIGQRGPIVVCSVGVALAALWLRPWGGGLLVAAGMYTVLVGHGLARVLARTLLMCSGTYLIGLGAAVVGAAAVFRLLDASQARSRIAHGAQSPGCEAGVLLQRRGPPAGVASGSGIMPE
jgi:hypothetical protein